MAARHEVAWTRQAFWLLKQLSCRTNSLETMMFDDQRLPQQQAIQNGAECWARHVDDIRFENECPKLRESWLTLYTERQCPILKMPCGCLCYDGYFEIWRSVEAALFCQPACQGKYDSLYATNTWSKVVRVDQQLHPGNLLCETYQTGG